MLRVLRDSLALKLQDGQLVIRISTHCLDFMMIEMRMYPLPMIVRNMMMVITITLLYSELMKSAEKDNIYAMHVGGFIILHLGRHPGTYSVLTEKLSCQEALHELASTRLKGENGPLLDAIFKVRT